MWTCPKCGRAFKRQDQSHYCGKAPKTIDEYIGAQPEEVRQYLREVRDALRAALPEAEERISWSMPTYWKKHNIIQFAGFKNHVGLYPGPEAVQEFSQRLKEYKTSKGTIQLPYSMAVPAELIYDIARWCCGTMNLAEQPKQCQKSEEGGSFMGNGGNEKVYRMDFSKVYHLLVNKAEKKGRTRQEVDQVILWLTGYSQTELERMLERPVAYGDFFEAAPELNENRKLIKGVVCGVRVEDIKEPLMQEIRYLDKLVDELARGKSMEKILRK